MVWGVGDGAEPRLAARRRSTARPWYYTWGAFVFIGVILGAGLLWYFVKGRHHIGTLESHAAATVTEAGGLSDG